MILTGTASYVATGLPPTHAVAIQEVADQTDHAIIFRAVGQACTTLLEEGYAAKGFRIDTKSCDWGPMSGFVCVDPRLSKVAADREKVAQNRHYTEEALAGKIRRDAVGGIPRGLTQGDTITGWLAGCKPVVISAARHAELQQNHGLQGVADREGIIHGTSQSRTGGYRMAWTLIPSRKCRLVPAYASACGPLPDGAYGVFFDSSGRQDLVGEAGGLRVLGYDAVMGLTNPGSEAYGYRSCVTGDYDLFGLWGPSDGRHDRFAAMHGTKVDQRAVDAYKDRAPGDAAPHFQQHYRLGNISPRLNHIKIFLNTALMAKGGYPGGNLVHHSDEIGNPSPGLRKSLDESFPLLAFVPRQRWKAAQLIEAGLCVANNHGFAQLVSKCRAAGIMPVLRPEWSRLFSA